MNDTYGVSRARLIKRDHLGRTTFYASLHGVTLVAEDCQLDGIEITATISNGWWKKWHLVRDMRHMNVEFLRHLAPYMAKHLRDELSYDAVADQYVLGRQKASPTESPHLTN